MKRSSLARALAATIAVVGACGKAHPPRGPAYTPVGSPEAPTPCPEEQQAAKEAREALLGDPSPVAFESAARAVYAQAECERQAFGRMSVEVASHDAMVEQVRELRRQHQNAVNLYEEVDNYGVERWAILATARLGALNAAFANRLSALPTPLDMRDAAERSGFRAEVGDLARTFEGRAQVALEAALDAGAGATDSEVAQVLASACETLAALAPESARRRCSN